MVLQPPISTDGMVPNRAAAAPARKLPSWFDVIVNIELTA